MGGGESECLCVHLFVNVVVAITERFKFLDVSYLVTKSSLFRKYCCLGIYGENVCLPQKRSLMFLI